MITFKEFVKKNLGKKIDYDGYAGCQCVDLAKLYLDQCFGIKCGSMGNAKDWWEKRKTNKILKDNFDFIKVDGHRPYSRTSLQSGDIGIRASGTYGHIFIIEKNTDTNVFYYDTNGTGCHDAMTRRIKPFTSFYVTGVLRKKTVNKKVTAKTGLHYYKTINDEPAGTIPYGKTVKVIVSGADKKKVGNVNYKMDIVLWNNEQVYVADKYLK